MSIQSTIQAKAGSYAPSMQRVAEAILQRPSVVMEKTISELAAQCETSETTIVRFCRTLGLSGYVQLRLVLANEIGREIGQWGGSNDQSTDIEEGDSLTVMVSKIAFAETLCISETLASVDVQVLEKVVAAIDGAGRTTMFGVSSSGRSATDLQAKLLRIGRIAFALTDSHEAVTSTALLSSDDVAIAFSHRGTTIETLQFLRSAKAAGATTVAVTNDATSPLATLADHFLLTMVRETQFRTGAMASRMAQLMIVDCIFVGVAHRRYESTVHALEVTYAAVGPLGPRT